MCRRRICPACALPLTALEMKLDCQLCVECRQDEVDGMPPGFTIAKRYVEQKKDIGR